MCGGGRGAWYEYRHGEPPLSMSDRWRTMVFKMPEIMPDSDSDPKLAMRNNEGKPELSYILTFPSALRGFARVCTYGAKKYARFNYLKGAPQSQYVDCLMRHLSAHWRGEEFDPESGCRHVDHVVWNALALSEFSDDEALDDRPENSKPCAST